MNFAKYYIGEIPTRIIIEPKFKMRNKKFTMKENRIIGFMQSGSLLLVQHTMETTPSAWLGDEMNNEHSVDNVKIKEL
jgi:hypothetical protein